MGENPPGYNMLTVNIPSSQAAGAGVVGGDIAEGGSTTHQASTSGSINSTSVQSNLSQAIDILQRVAQQNTAAVNTTTTTTTSVAGSINNLQQTGSGSVTLARTPDRSPNHNVSVDTIVDITTPQPSATADINNSVGGRCDQHGDVVSPAPDSVEVSAEQSMLKEVLVPATHTHINQ